MRFTAIWCLLAATLLVGCEQKKAAEPPAPAAATSAAPAAQNQGQELSTLVEAYYDKYLELNPLQATFIDDHRFDDRIANDIGPEAIAKSLALEKEYLDSV